ncbi:MAG: porin [Candidatus Polarisedimenticolia bacterium]
MSFGRRTTRPGWRALLAGVAVLWLAGGGVLAQGAFYVEELKDGRIYVFNLMSVYDEWKKTGEMGKSITRVGAGPNGETLVFDSEEAIHLYNFRHGLQGEVIFKPVEKKPVSNWSWKDGKSTFESDRALMVLSNRVQFRFTEEQPQNLESRGTYRIRRAKTKFEGWIYTKDLTYDLQMNWADTVDFTGRNQRILEDASLSYDFTRGRKAVMLKGGQFKVPFGRQELTSSGNLQFVDRSIVSTFFAGIFPRDQGIQLWGQTPMARIDWRTSMTNGNGINRALNDNDKYRWDVRVVWQPFGEVKYSEGDLETTDRPLLAIAAIYQADNVQIGDPNSTAFDFETWGGDVTFKYRGFSIVSDYFRRLNRPELAGAEDFESRGWDVQAGYCVYKRFVEVAARYAVIDPSNIATPGAPRVNDHQIERGVALSWYINKHNLKLQTDYTQIETESIESTLDQYHLQAQWIF